MKKRRIYWILVMYILVSAIPTAASAKDIGQEVGENIVYELYDYQWKSGTLQVRGCTANLNESYDLLGLQDAVMVLTDSEGLELCYIELNDTFQENCILKPMSKRPYNFTVKSLEYDASDYSSLTSGLQVFFIYLGYTYDECQGARCPNCRNIGLDLDENPFLEEALEEPAKSSEKNCFFCGGNGVCDTCEGTGKYEPLDGTLWGSRCRVCDGTGICQACHGDGVLG